MLRLLIPLIDKGGAPVAARHAAFLLRERCMAQVELLEVLPSLDYGRAAAFHSRARLLRRAQREQQALHDACLRTRAILDDSGVPYTSYTVSGPAARTIAARAAEQQFDAVLIDASRYNLLRRIAMVLALWRRTFTPVTLLH
jgi:hypothetical protein